MNEKAFLRAELKLLVLRYGRKAIIESLSTFDGTSIEDLEDEIQRLKSKSRARAPRAEKSPEAMLDSMNVGEEFRKVVLSIVERFRSKMFLPTLRDTSAFLQTTGISKRSIKSRQNALPFVVEALTRMNLPQLQAIHKDLTRYGDQSDFTILANKLMGKPRRDE